MEQFLRLNGLNGLHVGESPDNRLNDDHVFVDADDSPRGTGTRLFDS